MSSVVKTTKALNTNKDSSKILLDKKLNKKTVEKYQEEKEEKEVKTSSTDIEDVVLPRVKVGTEKMVRFSTEKTVGSKKGYIDEEKYKKLGETELAEYTNDDLASVLFVKFRKDGNPLARLALDIFIV